MSSMRFAWLTCVAVLFSACLLYNDDLLEPADDDAGAATTTTSGGGGMGGATTSSAVGGMTTTSTTATTATTTTSSTTATTTTTAGGGSAVAADLWINELHYDNDSGDVDEGVEIAGPAGTSLSGYELIFYNGNNGASYDTETLAGTIPEQQNGYGTVWFPVSGIQNGAPDGVALVFGGSEVLQFLSYEGSITAAGGPAAGMTSVDVVVSEEPAPAVGMSLQLIGTGNTYSDFSWQGPTTATPNQPSSGQTLQ